MRERAFVHHHWLDTSYHPAEEKRAALDHWEGEREWTQANDHRSSLDKTSNEETEKLSKSCGILQSVAV